MTTASPTIVLRPANFADEDDLRRLAALDSSRPLKDPVLLARVDGEVLAALSMTDGQTIADPFAPTGELVDLLRLRAALLSERAPLRRRFRLGRRAGARQTVQSPALAP